VAHTHEILEIAQAEFSAAFGVDAIAVVDDADQLSEAKRVSLLTIQFVTRNLASISASKFDYVVVDEFHHAAAKTYRNFLSALKPTFILGLTATPFREDRQDIAALCDNRILVNYSLRAGIDMGVLCPYHYYGCFDNIDYSKISQHNIGYDIRDLERALIIPERNRAIIRKWKELAENKPSLAFCCSQRHAQRMAEAFNREGINAGAYLGTTERREREDLLEKFRLGDLKVLCVVDVLNEGVDIPFVECLLFLRPTESKRIFFQQLGRGLRRYLAKSRCTVIDFIGNFRNAYKIVEYQSLLPTKVDDSYTDLAHARSSKDILNLPLGCEVFFERNVIDIFYDQLNDPARANRSNIARILQHNYERLQRSLGRRPSRKDLDRYSLLPADLYRQVFGSWRNFEGLQQPESERQLTGVL
jgi:superfamily II DNA or RNA helicase